MMGYHVTTRRKFLRYVAHGGIRPPVRFWPDLVDAERFAKQTGRRVIVRIRVDPASVRPLEGHWGRALVSDQIVPVDEW